MFKKILSLYFLLVCSASSFVFAASEYRQIQIPQSENGYDTIQSQVIGSKPEFDKFLKTVEAQEFWNKKAEFLAKMKEAKINFASEALVLLRDTEGSGSTSVKASEPQIRGKQMVFAVSRKVAEMGTADMAYYCFAVVVNRDAVKEVLFQVSGRPSVALSVPKIDAMKR